MQIKIRCTCGNMLMVPEERVGHTGKCPACDRSITVKSPELEEGSQTESKKKYISPSPRNEKKFSFFGFIISLLIYAIFFILLAGFISLHYFDSKQISAFDVKEGSSGIKKIWKCYKPTILFLKKSQGKICKKLFLDGKKLFEKKKTITHQKEKNQKISSIEQIQNSIQQYKEKHGKWPHTLDDIDNLPEPAENKEWNYNQITHKVTEIDIQIIPKKSKILIFLENRAKKILNNYKAKHGKYPDSLLKLKNFPKLDKSREWSYDKKTGEIKIKERK